LSAPEVSHATNQRILYHGLEILGVLLVSALSLRFVECGLYSNNTALHVDGFLAEVRLV